MRYRWITPEASRGEVLVLEVCGDIDMATAPDLRQTVMTQLAAADLERSVLLIDLRKVTFMGSSALALFVESTGLCARRGLDLRLIADTRTTRRPLEASGLIRELNVFTDYRAALSAR